MSVQGAINGDHRSRKIVEAWLVDIMQEQEASCVMPCPTAVSSAVTIFIGYDPKVESHKDLATTLRKLYPKVIRASIRFLMAPRTTEQRRHMALFEEQPFGHCQCNTDHPFDSHPFLRDLHTLIKRHATLTALSKFLRPLFMLSAIAFNYTLVDTGGWRALKRARKAPHHRQDLSIWPSTYTDLFPFGTETSVMYICAWADIHEDFYMTHLIYMAFFYAMDCVMTGPLVTAVYPCVTSALEAILARWENESAKTSRAARNTFGELHVCAPFLDCLADVGFGRLPLAVAQNHDVLIPLVDVCGRVIKTVFDMAKNFADADPQPEDPLAAHFVRFAGQLRVLLNLVAGDASEDEIAGVRLDPRVREHAERLQLEPALRFLSYLPFIHDGGRICAAPGCAHTALAIEHTLYACSGCQHVYYCSKTCQKNAWRYPPAPHREICPVVRDVMYLVEPLIPDIPDNMLTLPVREDFLGQCTHAGVDTATMARMVEYLDLIYT